jgi:hypothetical protein
MADPKAPAGAKVSAAKGLLEFSRESIEVDDLAARADALEARARQIDDTSLVDATSFEVKDIDTPPEALPGGAWVTADGVQPDFKADSENFQVRPENKK